MNKSGPIVIIDDDADDQELLQELFTELQVPNELVFLRDGHAALTFLKQPHIRPFLILSDISMPGMNGFALREHIIKDPDLAMKCVPFIFCTTGASLSIVSDAYRHSVQGIFQKPSNYQDWLEILKAIFQYWNHGLVPNCY